ncbi:MAG: hypothetical protein HKM02_03700 [Pseudomonadales bacterium]|nr:hypothetical protein [Pseudomonadales bacterium]
MWLRKGLLVVSTTTLLSGYMVNASATSITFSGFADFTAGNVLGGSGPSNYQIPAFLPNGVNSPTSLYPSYKCPCFISNYEYGGIYQHTGWDLANESMVGIQANAQVNDQLSAVVQIDARGLDGYQPTVDWAYTSYNLTNTLTIQAGRKRLPLYMYSDYNYVGYAYPWVRPPVDLYGWEVYSYDGINVQYNNAIGDWALMTNTWAGNSVDPNAPGLTNVYNGFVTDTAWKDIIGTSIDLSNDYVHLRAVYMQNKVFQGTPNVAINNGQGIISNTIPQTAMFNDTPITNFTYPSSGNPNGVVNNNLVWGTLQQVWGAAFNIDYNNILWRSEYNFVRRPQMGYVAPSLLAGAGYKYGQVTAMYTYSQYWESDSWLHTFPQRDNTRAVTLRWDFRPSVCLKLQYDLFMDHSVGYTAPGQVAPSSDWFLGSSKLLTASLDMVF